MSERKLLVFGPDPVLAELIARHLEEHEDLRIRCEVRTAPDVTAADGDATKIVAPEMVSERSREALQARADADGNDNPADPLGISRWTYNEWLKVARRELECDSAAAALVKAFRLGLIR